MKRNLAALFIANSLFGLAFGVYDLAFPLFMDDQGVHLEGIALVLAGAGAVNFFIVVYGGRLADLMGRKRVYGAGLLACAVTHVATPFAPQLAALAVVRTINQAGSSVRQVLRGVLVFESVALERFSRTFGRLAGLEVCFQTIGFAFVGMVGLGPEAVLSYRGLFVLSGVSLALAVLLFWHLFREPPAPAPEKGLPLSLRRVFALDLHPKLYLITVSGFVFCVGLAMSHTLWALYFRRQLAGPWSANLAAFEEAVRAVWPGAARFWAGGERGPEFALLGLLAVIHRLSLGIPMFLVLPLIRRRFKAWYVGCLGLSGAFTAAVALADWLGGGFVAVALLWPLHDLLGSSIWFPIQERFLLEYARPEQRGTQVAKVRAMMALGLVLGAAVAGSLMAASPALPFFVGGGLIVLASLILLPL